MASFGGINVTVLVIGSGTGMGKQLLDKQDIDVKSGEIIDIQEDYTKDLLWGNTGAITAGSPSHFGITLKHMLSRIRIRVVCEMGLLTVYNDSKHGGYQPTERDTVCRKCITFYSPHSFDDKRYTDPFSYIDDSYTQ
ncbi:hypothetical protein [Bacteroides helcogenes]|uniref:Uncharacterized protein n=1 Tax=Bacteroides helcogenes (strain ATCC 35417 / DSM 20613 / JCM 6297 / CCUG 15421 / P 36-108) TaxID=693979 RepID=E6SVD3_BACT6|nr:hypothetical protein [Bacteroides helcogenes]ADV44499.1 hypothetical protein Bache_2537 [Bacteroides helcogenes P 36-108]MDY5239026.1 hypothetical protein [Bacteroides helcogenes]